MLQYTFLARQCMAVPFTEKGSTRHDIYVGTMTL